MNRPPPTIKAELQDPDTDLDVNTVGLTHSSAHARGNHPSKHVCTTSRAEDQPEDNRNNDIECPKHLVGPSESRRSSNNQKNSPTWVALSDMMAEQAATSGITSTRPRARN